MRKPIISVIMPTFEQSSFIVRAIMSLKVQTFRDWELIIIDDGSKDDTYEVLQAVVYSPRIRYFKLKKNIGLSAAINVGFTKANGKYIAYLPSDDVLYETHLETLIKTLEKNPKAIATYSGVRHDYNRNAKEQIDGYSLQLVQVLHKRVNEKWVERDELVTDDLGKMYWEKLKTHGTFIPTKKITCEWVDHPDQLHKLIREPEGGINPFRVRFNIQHPLKFHTSVGNLIDEVEHYKQFRERPNTPVSKEGLKIVLVGELAYNSERILALEERGHKLYGLWIKNPYWYNTVGPLPFGHVEDINYEHWIEEIKKIKPDIIYGLLNWQAVPFAHEILMNNPRIPFVWHFKEGPFICLEKGTWNKLMDLYTKSHGQIYTSPEMRDWFKTFLPEINEERTLILDGDLPKKEWFSEERSELLSKKTGEIHTVVLERPIDLHPQTVDELVAQKIHVHFYGDSTHSQWNEWFENTKKPASKYLHIHSNVDQEQWVKEFSQYDAGWLHFLQSENNGEIRRANWDDLNYPTRMATLAMAGVPLLQRDNSGHIVATQSLIKKYNLGIFFKDINSLGKLLKDKKKMQEIRESVWKNRMEFCFDNHTDKLITYFQKIIKLS